MFGNFYFQATLPKIIRRYFLRTTKKSELLEEGKCKVDQANKHQRMIDTSYNLHIEIGL